MNSNASPDVGAAIGLPSSQVSEVARILEDYLIGLERGEPIDREAVLARHPELAEGLRTYLDQLEILHRAALNVCETVLPAAEPMLGQLGDFRLVREIGRGGMGIVYEAQQQSLNRRVALKVLPLAATVDARQLQRFKNEAQAAAQLHHQSIVPVFAVGCERGTHYYAMQYIDGQTLAAVIDDLRREQGLKSASVRSADAGTGMTAAAAESTTEQSGRETQKLMRSALSEPDLTLFRVLARMGIQAAQALEYAHQQGVVHRDIKPGNLLMDARCNLWIADFGLAAFRGHPSLTATGDVVGTLRYMSPEQALGGRDLLDHRTDIYSLGATLYELLTLEPAFPQSLRQEVLRRLTDEEPPPLRTRNAAIPLDLETIVLKAMSREAESRYATAQQLADDLQRFLDDKPILAKRPTLGQRAKKWGRRHRGIVTTVTVGLAVGLVSAVVVLAISNARITRAREDTVKALAQAKEDHHHAEVNFEKALQAVEQMLVRVAEERLAVPHMEEVRRAMLQDALTFYQGFSEERQADPRVRLATARASELVGTIHWNLGELGAAQTEYRKGTAVLKKLAEEFPREAKYRMRLAATTNSLAVCLRVTGDSAEAAKHFGRSIALWQELIQESPANIGYRSSLAEGFHAQGYFLAGQGRWREARHAYEQALKVQDELVEQNPMNERFRASQAETYSSLGLLLRSIKKYADAERAHRQALAVLTVPQATDVATRHIRGEEARALTHLGVLLSDMGSLAESEKALRRALHLREQVATEWPTRGTLLEWALTLPSLGNALAADGRFPEAEQLFQKALADLERMRTVWPQVPDYSRHVAANRRLLGNVQHRTGRNAEAQQTYVAASEAYRSALKQEPSDAKIQAAFARFLTLCPLHAMRDPKQALALAEQAVKYVPLQAQYWNTLGTAHYRAGNWDLALSALLESIRLGGGGSSADFLVLSLVRHQLGNPREARLALDKAEREIMNARVWNEELRHLLEEAKARLPQQ